MEINFLEFNPFEFGSNLNVNLNVPNWRENYQNGFSV
jgi:hypothetical protein